MGMARRSNRLLTLGLAGVAACAPQVLVLVGTDRLDRPLTIGQMQGKFQPVLLPQVSRCSWTGLGLVW